MIAPISSVRLWCFSCALIQLQVINGEQLQPVLGLQPPRADRTSNMLHGGALVDVERRGRQITDGLHHAVPPTVPDVAAAQPMPADVRDDTYRMNSPSFSISSENDPGDVARQRRVLCHVPSGSCSSPLHLAAPRWSASPGWNPRDVVEVGEA